MASPRNGKAARFVVTEALEPVIKFNFVECPITLSQDRGACTVLVGERFCPDDSVGELQRAVTNIPAWPFGLSSAAPLEQRKKRT